MPGSQAQQQVAAQRGQQQAVAKTVKPVDKLKSVLNADSIQSQFKNALKENSGTFIASVIDLFNGDLALQRCDPNKIVCEALKAAVLHLPISKALGQAYIIPYENNKKVVDPQTGKEVWQKVMEPTFQLGYRGFIQLALRSKVYKTINAGAVYEGELRSISKLTGEIDIEGQKTSDKVIGYFAYFETVDGYKKAQYMSVEGMAAHAKRFSKAIKKDVTEQMLVALAAQPMTGEGKAVGWMGNFHGMAIKTVVRLLLSKWGTLSVEMEKAVVDDQSGDNYEIRNGEIQNQPQTIVLEEGEYETVGGSAPVAAQAPGFAPVEEDPGY